MPAHNPYLNLDRLIVGDVYTSSETMDNLLVLCDELGSRFGGTPGERQAAEFMAGRMQEYGLQNVQLDPVPYTGWTRGRTQLEIIHPIHKVIPCISLPHSPPAELEAELLDMGDGAPGDFEQRAAEIRGKIVMVNSKVGPKNSRRWVHRSEKYGRSLLAGAVGFIFANHYPGLGAPTGSIGHDGQALVPGVGISLEDGAFIQRLARRGEPVRLRLHSSDHCSSMTSWNVLGDLPGRERPQELVILGCHYDGHDIAQGASDPASGVVALLEAARVLALHAPDLTRTVRFALWGVEEIGLLGSRAYVAGRPAELARIRFYLNMDGAGAVNNLRDLVLNEWPALELLFSRWRDEMDWPFAVGQSLNAFSDHFPFFMAGVPTGGLETLESNLSGRGFGHTRHDTVDKVEIDGLREAAALAARLALRIANSADWPAGRRTTQEVQALLDSPDYREERTLRERVDALYQQARAAAGAAQS